MFKRSLLLLGALNAFANVPSYATLQEGRNKSLLSAIETGDSDLVKSLIDLKVNVNLRGQVRSTALHRAIENGRIEIAQLLIDAGADVNAQDAHGLAPLHRAAEKGLIGMVKLLVAAKADMEKEDSDGKTPLAYATTNDRRDIVRFLVGKGVNCNKSLEVAPDLWWLPLERRLELVRILIDGSTDSAARSRALLVAAGYGAIKMSSLLLEKGVDLNITNSDGCTPLCEAWRFGSPELVRLLKKHGACYGTRCKHSSSCIIA